MLLFFYILCAAHFREYHPSVVLYNIIRLLGDPPNIKYSTDLMIEWSSITGRVNKKKTKKCNEEEEKQRTNETFAL